MAEVLSRKDRFAELLSQGLDIQVIAERMGLNNATAQTIMTRICKGLGPQARG